MKKSELKKVLKPLIKECIKECIFEDGVLSGIIKEVATGMKPIVQEGAPTTRTQSVGLTNEERRLREEQYETDRQERIRRLNEVSRFGSEDINLFEGVEPIPETPEGSAQGPLSGVAPGDPGLDIGGIINMVGDKWRKLS